VPAAGRREQSMVKAVIRLFVVGGGKMEEDG